jgi:hypothetical protein
MIAVAPDGTIVEEFATDYYGQAQGLPPFFQYEYWLNVWFYDHPFDWDRYKVIQLEFMAARLDPESPSFVQIAFNWSTPEWSLEGNPPGARRPPLPGEDEDLYIVREIALETDDLTMEPQPFVFELVIPNYNPEWVSVDVAGFNFIADGIITHECLEACAVDCDPLDIDEAEGPCHDDFFDIYNGGCNSTPPIFQPINCSESICGFTGNYRVDGQPGFRDTDWFELRHHGGPLTWSAIAECPIRIFVIDPESEDCEDFTILGTATAPQCEVATITIDDLPPGWYWLWLGPLEFVGWPCDSRYEATATCEDALPVWNRFAVAIDENGELIGSPFWFLYPSGWFNVWFYDHLFDPHRFKRISLDVEVQRLLDGPASLTLALNYSTPEWFEDPDGNPLSDPLRIQPLPGEDEELFIVREVLFDDEVTDPFELDAIIDIPDFNPEWVSIDIMGSNILLTGIIKHACLRKCISDMTGPDGQPDGVVDVADLLVLLAEWGEGAGSPGDISGPWGAPDGIVNVQDLLRLLADWGPC